MLTDGKTKAELLTLRLGGGRMRKYFEQHCKIEAAAKAAFINPFCFNQTAKAAAKRR